MPIPVNDLDIYPILKGEQILELLFGEAATKYLNDRNVPGDLLLPIQAAKDFIQWATVAWKNNSEIIMLSSPLHSGRGVNWFKMFDVS